MAADFVNADDYLSSIQKIQELAEKGCQRGFDCQRIVYGIQRACTNNIGYAKNFMRRTRQHVERFV